MWTGKDIPADTHRVDDLRGWDLAMGLRGLLAGTWQADFDGMLELFALAPGDVSECGAFLALTGAFDIGTATRRWFEQWDPWRLEPGPTI